MTKIRDAPGKTRGQISQKPLRTDRWWQQPAVNAIGLGAAVVYLTWASLVNTNYFWRPYISPLYSPCIASKCPAGSGWDWIPWVGWLTPAILIILGPIGFRFTCYYYPKAYYRAFCHPPPSSPVPQPPPQYTAQPTFPLLF